MVETSLRPLASGLAACAAALLVGACELPPSRTDYGEMFRDVEEEVWENGYEDGAWSPDWDDAPFYGVAFYSRLGWGEEREDYQQRAAEAVEHNLAVAREGIADAETFVENMSAILYGTLGVIEYIDASDDTEPLETVDETIDMANGMLELLGWYVQGEGSYAIDTYGPTSITAVFAMVNLQYAVLLDTPRTQDRIDTAARIAERVDEVAWNGDYYLFAPDREGYLDLYPNVAMIIVLARLYELTSDEAYLERAEAVYEAIQELKCPDRPGYKSLYSAEYMGAETDDYTTLSATNYTTLAMSLLYQATGDEQYRAEIDDQLELVEQYLWVPGEGRVLHHWMDGRLAVPTDPEYYCIGCNLQLLYIIWWVHTYVD